MSGMEDIIESFQTAYKDGRFVTLTSPLSAEERKQLSPYLAKNFDVYLSSVKKGDVTIFNSDVVASTFSGEKVDSYVAKLGYAFSHSESLKSFALGSEVKKMGTSLVSFTEGQMETLLNSLPKKIETIQLSQARKNDVLVLSSILKDSECKNLSLYFEPRDKVKLDKESLAKFRYNLAQSKVENLSIIAPGQGEDHPMFGKNVSVVGLGSKNTFNRKNKMLTSLAQVMRAHPVYDGRLGEFIFKLGSDEKKVEPPKGKIPFDKVINMGPIQEVVREFRRRQNEARRKAKEALNATKEKLNTGKEKLNATKEKLNAGKEKLDANIMNAVAKAKGRATHD